MSDEQAPQVIDQALQPVAQGTISADEYAYQQARRRLRAVLGELEVAVKAVNALQPGLLQAWLRESYPDLRFTVKSELFPSGSGFIMRTTMSPMTSMNHNDVLAIHREAERYLDELANDVLLTQSSSS